MKRKTIFNIPCEFYWIRKIHMPVKFPFGIFMWRGLYGVQIGDLFIGVIIGSEENNENQPGKRATWKC